MREVHLPTVRAVRVPRAVVRGRRTVPVGTVTVVLVAILLAACSSAAGSSASGPGGSATDRPVDTPSTSSTASTGGGGVDASLSSVKGDPQALVRRVRPARLMHDIRTLARTPRHVVDDHGRALAAARHIETELDRAGLRPHRIDVTADGVTLPTVWAQIRGTQCPDRVFVLTGHYDTVPGSRGADDDASGVAGMLETARVLAHATLPATVVVAGVPFEEDGMPYPGSSALATELLDHQKREVIGMVSAEMLGYALPKPAADGDPGDYLYLLGYQDAKQLVQIFDRANTAWAGGAKLDAGTVPETESYISRSDHAAFHTHGVPAAFATDGANFRTPYYHTPEDVPAHIVRPFLTGAVRTLVAGTIGMAGRTTACAG